MTLQATIENDEMLVVHLEVWPGGDSTKRRKIGQINITNDGTGTEEVGNYNISASHAGKYYGTNPKPYKIGKLAGFNRSLSPYRLLSRALKAIREM